MCPKINQIEKNACAGTLDMIRNNKMYLGYNGEIIRKNEKP